MSSLPKVISAPEWDELRQFEPVREGWGLIADASHVELRDKCDEYVLGAETEGYGFARACAEAGVPESVIRGVSDYGDPKSKDGVEH